MADFKVSEIRNRARSKQMAAATDEERAHWQSIYNDFGRWIEKRELPVFTRSLVAPPGDPFGMDPWGGGQ